MNTKELKTEQTKDLVDISTVNVDPSLPKEERIKEFARQIKNPNNFMCCGYEVTVSFANTKRTMEDCLANIVK